MSALRNHFVYRVYNASEQVIYVGLTRSPEHRWGVHKHLKADMIKVAARCAMSGPYTHEVARRREMHLIHMHQPAFNTYGTGYVRCACGCEDAA